MFVDGVHEVLCRPFLLSFSISIFAPRPGSRSLTLERALIRRKEKQKKR